MVEVGAQAVEVADPGCGFGCGQRPSHGKVRHVVRGGIGQHRHGVVADHAPVFVGVVAPDGQHAVDALVGVGEHAFDEVGRLVRLGEVDPRMQGAIGVPEGKDGVVGEAVRCVDVLVQTAVPAVHVLVEDRTEHAVVEGRAEGGQLSGAEEGVLFHRPNPGHGHGVIPGGARLFPGAIEPL